MKRAAIAVCSALFFCSVLIARTQAAVAIGPDGLAFYDAPASASSQPAGTAIWARPFTGGSALTAAATNYLVLYETATANGRPAAVSGTLSLPQGVAPAGGWPLISWAHGTTGNAPACAPSRFKRPDDEQRMLNEWVRRGYAVAQTDYEGEASPGIHPYMVGKAYTHDVADIARAARAVDPSIGTKWLVMGHSEGGAATLLTASAAQAYAPELQLVGAVAYAPASHIGMFLHDIASSPYPAPSLVFMGYMLEGFASVDPQVDLSTLLTPAGMKMLPLLQQACNDALQEGAWGQTAPSDFFRRNPDFSKIQIDFDSNEPGSVEYGVPTLLIQGLADPVVTPSLTQDLHRRLCVNLVPLTYREYPGADHSTVMLDSLGDATSWVAARFAGDAPFQIGVPKLGAA